ncbi:Dihydrolipoamide acyltransferase, partial [Giardia duodenalis]
SAFLGCSAGVHTAGPEAKESLRGPDPHHERKIVPPDPREQAVSLYLGDHSEDVCPLAGHTCWLCGLPCESAKQLTEHLREANDDRHRVLGDDKLIIPSHIPNQTAAMLIHQGAA